ncbi:MAG: LPS assembly lipoprotein LptE [Planctomycetota bacterium]|jgi:hypothetical protein
MTGRTLACAAGLSTALILSGCASDPTEGYAFASPYPEGMRTVAVNVFENDTYERGVEFEFADALVKEIEARTPYKVTSAKRADTILTGRIRNVERDQLSKSRVTGLSEEVTRSELEGPPHGRVVAGAQIVYRHEPVRAVEADRRADRTGRVWRRRTTGP